MTSTTKQISAEAERITALYSPEPNSGCWLWMGSYNWKGYGQVDFRGKKAKAHRASWMVFRGDIPKGICVLHKCDNPACINPDHLFLGTNNDNFQDMRRKGREKKMKLNPEKVREIRRRKALGENYSDMAAEFGVADSTLRQAGRRESWAHVK